MDRLTRATVIALTFSLMCNSAALSASNAVKGTWALAGSAPKITGYIVAIRRPEGTLLDIVQFRGGSRTPIISYALAMNAYMHFIIVRDDFHDFLHLHPVLRGGHFRVPVTLAAGHRYYAYADSEPTKLGQQVLRFALQGEVPPGHQDTAVSASPNYVAAGPYVVRLSATTVRASLPQPLIARITRNGMPATDLHPYLGASAHAVLINTADLTYIHVHPTSSSPMRGMMTETLPANITVGPTLRLNTKVRKGVYKLWLQFRGGSTVYVAPFTIVAR
ncbi:MAG: hypothetical protein DLM50_05405 [Candidatus Meridianibacter frigidus]|nr:MAG: hypothetical protein DLM50_05405 [Candidatus Eremiobacteraeota bacterium]